MCLTFVSCLIDNKHFYDIKAVSYSVIVKICKFLGFGVWGLGFGVWGLGVIAKTITVLLVA